VEIMTSRRIPLLDLHAQFDAVGGEIEDAIRQVLASQKFILGEQVERLEKELARYCGTRFAVGCASGTDALVLALAALDIGPGDEVLTTPFSFFATASAIVRVGARPVFADIDPATFNLDPEAVEEALKAHPRIKALLPVHLFGACAPMGYLCRVAQERGLAVIEDAAQAIGAEYEGRRAGSLGQVGCFSFFPSKNLGGAGDGGLLTTDSDEVAARLRSLRVHGSKIKYFHEEVGYNSRLDTLQAAVLLAKLPHLDHWTAARQRNAELYRRYLGELHAPVIVPAPVPGCNRHVFNQFVIRTADRDQLRGFLSGQGIATEVYYPLPLPNQPCFAYLGNLAGAFPAAEKCAAECLALPVYPELPEDAIAYISESIAAFHRRRA